MPRITNKAEIKRRMRKQGVDMIRFETLDYIMQVIDSFVDELIDACDVVLTSRRATKLDKSDVKMALELVRNKLNDIFDLRLVRYHDKKCL